MRAKLYKTLLLIAFGATLIIAGIYRNEIDTVYRKASVICLECIGIG